MEKEPTIPTPEASQSDKEQLEKAKERIDKAIEIAIQSGSIDGAHHKMWVIDQMLRALAGDKYTEIVKEAKAGEDGPETYEWDEGISP